MKSVKEVSQLSGVSVRTLHYYDEIDLLKPSVVAENGYRYYNRDAVVRLQEILLYRELDFPLKKIKDIVGKPGYDKVQALRDQIKLDGVRQKLIKLLRLRKRSPSLKLQRR